MLRPWKHALIFLCAFTSVLAVPTTDGSLTLAKRQFDGPKTVTTVEQFETPSGKFTRTCEITLTPIKDDKGVDAVREDKICKITSDSSQGGSGGQTTTSSSATTTATETATSTSSSSSAAETSSSSSAGESTSTTSSSSSSTETAAPTSSSSSETAAPTTTASSSSNNGGVSEVTPAGTPAVSANPVSTVPTAGTPTTTQGASGGSTESPSASPLPASTVAAAAENASSSAVFQIPGKKLEVLPIGLGVFAGISVIALIVVGLVTYERTKYRRAFRARRLAEQGQAMPYGGMAER